jgi:hypothetical protein
MASAPLRKGCQPCRSPLGLGSTAGKTAPAADAVRYPRRPGATTRTFAPLQEEPPPVRSAHLGLVEAPFVRACPRRQTTPWSQTAISETVKHPRGPPSGSWYTCIALWNLHKRPRLVVLGALALYLIVLTIQHQAGKLLPGRVLFDPFDIGVYYKRAQFYPQSKTPYTEVFSEYPALATLSFAAPLLLDKNMPLANYRLAWNFFMTCFFIGTVLLVYNSRVLLGLDTTPLLLFASPTVLYFSLMRFDILCAFFVSLSLYLYLKENTFSPTLSSQPSSTSNGTPL